MIIGCQVQLQSRLIKTNINYYYGYIVFMLSGVNINIVLSYIHFTIFKSILQIAQAHRKEQHITIYTVSGINLYKNV